MGTMEITTVVGCENDCKYCPQDKLIEAYSKRANGVRKMSIDVFKECLDKIPKNVRIDFSGMAEPWLNPGCTRMLLYAYERGYRVAVYTTAVGMSCEDVGLIKDIVYDEFVLHLPDREGYSKIAINDDYINVIRKLSKTICNISYMSMGTLPKEIEVAINKYVPPSYLISRAGHVEVGKNVVKTKRLKGCIFCKPGSEQLDHNILLPNGDVILCAMDFGMKHILGNLLLSGYEELLTGEELRNVKRGLKDSSINVLCRHCTEARMDKLSIPFMFELLRNYKLFYRLNSKIKKYINNIKHV